MLPEDDLDALYTVDTLFLPHDAVERLDTLLLASSGRAWEHIQSHAPRLRPLKVAWSVEEMRTSLFGQALLVIVAYVNQRTWSVTWWVDETDVKRAIRRVYRLLHGNISDDGYFLPKDFHLSDLGRLIDQAHHRLYGSRAWVGVAKAAREVGVARQSVYEREREGKLLGIHWPRGVLRVLTTDLDMWIEEREREQRAEARKKKKAAQAEKDG